MKTFALIVLAAFIAWAAYLSTQQPQWFCNSEWAGFSLLRGGVRSWTLRFCDGQTSINGKWQCIVITSNGVRPGHFLIPQYRHIDFRYFKFTGGYIISDGSGLTNIAIKGNLTTTNQ